jgi:hypothetical protein
MAERGRVKLSGPDAAETAARIAAKLKRSLRAPIEGLPAGWTSLRLRR